MSSLPQVAAAIQTVLTEVPEAVARSTGFLKRRSKLTPARFVQTLVLGWWQHPAATLTQLGQMAAALGVGISPQGLDQRFTKAAADLLRDRVETAIGQVITAEPVVNDVLRRFPAVYLLDSTTVALPDALASVWPGCGGRVEQGSQAALKATVRFDLVAGGLGLALSPGRTQDKSTSLQHAPVPEEALRIADQGFWSLAVLAQIAADGGYSLSRLHLQTTVWVAGERIDLVPWLAAQPTAEVDVAVTLGVAAQVAARVLAVRVPQEAADQRRRKLREAAQRDGKAPNPRAMALADWTLLVTNAPVAKLSVREALVLGRLRWQIELLFKLWKSHGGHLAQSRGTGDWRVLCEGYAKLIAMVLQHWVLLVGCWVFADRSLVRAAKTVRDCVLVLALGLAHLALLVATLELIGRCLAVGCTVDKRANRPSACQLLADPARCFA